MASLSHILWRRATASALATGAVLVSAASASAAPVTVTLGFDDGMGTRNDPAAILAATGTRATFYVNTATVDRASVDEAWSHEFLSWDQLAALHAAGHEIAGHTLHHTRLTPPDAQQPPSVDPAPPDPGPPEPAPPDPALTGPTEAEVRTEVCDDRAALLAAGYPARSFAHPFGRSDARSRAIVQECGYLSGRSTSAPDPAETLPPVDPFATEAFNTGGMSGEALLDLVRAAEARGGGWVQLIFHDICETTDPLCSGTPAESVTPRALEDLVAGLVADPQVRIRTAGDVIGAAAESTPPTFPTTTVGTTSDAIAVIRNTGGAALTLGALTLRGTPDAFRVSTDACGGKTLDPGSSCTAVIRFAPTAATTSHAQLELPGNTDPQVTVVPLAATAEAPPADDANPAPGPGTTGTQPAGSPPSPLDPVGTAALPATPVPPPPLADPPGTGPSAQLDATRAAAVRRTRARLLRARSRALRACNRKATRRTRAACRTRIRARYARRLARLPVARVASTRR